MEESTALISRDRSLSNHSNITDDDNPTENPGQNDPVTRHDSQFNGICGCCKWYMKGPQCESAHLQFTVWVIFFTLSPIFYIVYLVQEDEEAFINYGYIIICLLSLLVSMYASCNFQNVLKLRGEVDRLIKSTKHFGKQRDKTRNEVAKLNEARNQLSEIEKNLNDNNQDLRKYFKKFESWNNTIEEATNNQSEAAKQVDNDFRNAIKTYQQMLEQHERSILDKAYQHVQLKDGKPGLTKNEFDDLFNTLPPRYKAKMQEMQKGFDDFDEDKNGIIDESEFREFMDFMVTEQTLAGVNISDKYISKKKGGSGYNDDEKDDEKDRK